MINYVKIKIENILNSKSMNFKTFCNCHKCYISILPNERLFWSRMKMQYPPD